MRLLSAQIEAADGNIDAAEGILDELSLKEAQSQEVAALRSELFFYRAVQQAPSLEALARQVASGEGGSAAQYQLACREVLAGDFETALERLLELLRKDRAYGDDAARKGMVAIFDLLGGEGDLVAAYRGRMARALY
jgi:putative thioredoxin